jgi:hypothetical protein
MDRPLIAHDALDRYDEVTSGNSVYLGRIEPAAGPIGAHLVLLSPVRHGVEVDFIDLDFRSRRLNQLRAP